MKGAWRTLRLIIKESRQMRRDALTLRLTLVAPVLQLVLLGYAATLDVRDVPTVVCDLDHSVASRRLLRDIMESRYFREVGREERLDRVAGWLDRGDATMALVIPVDYSRLLKSGQQATVQALVDGSNSTEATTAVGYLGEIMLDQAIRTAVVRYPPETFRGRPAPPVATETRVWYNESLESSHFMVPGVIGLILMVTTMLLTAVAVVREKEIGTIEQVLVTPVRAHEFLLGKMIPYSLLGLFNVAVVLAVARYWFEIPLRGSLTLLFALSGVFLLTTLGAGLLAATVARTQQAAMLLCMAYFTPNMLLSGFIFPIDNMPAAIQGLTFVMPMRYFLIIIRGILLKGIGAEVLWPQALALGLLGGGIFLASLAAFRSGLRPRAG